MSNKKERLFKCPYCDERLNRTDLVYHIDEEHEDMIPQDYTASRVVFNYINKKECGKCIMCGKETKWNDKVWRYDRLCSNKCHDEYVKLVKSRMVNKYGKEHILDDPEHQKKMLSNRKISGTYKFSDGGVREYVGSYERKLLEFYDKVLQVPSKDILTPGPIVEYEFKGKKHTWITDLYYVPANLVHDVKDGGSNPNNREMGEYRAKQDAKEKAIKELDKYNYIRLTDNNFQQLLLILSELKELMMDNKEDVIIRINEEVAAGAVANTSAENNVYIIPYYMNNVFVGTALSTDKYMKDLYMVKDGEIKKSSIHDIADYEHYMYKYLGECNIHDIIDNKDSNLLPDYFYTSISNKKLIDPNQFEFDEMLEEEINGYTENYLKKTIIQFSMEHQSRELYNSNIYFECRLDDYKMKSILSRYPNVSVMEDINGYFAYNKSLETRTASYDSVYPLYNTIKILNDYKV